MSQTVDHQILVPLDIADVPHRELVSLPIRSESTKPTHVRSVPQMHAFAQHVKNSTAVTEHGLVADPGLGKSTLFPLMLAKSSKHVVLLIEFCGSLAECVFDGLTRVRNASAEYKTVGVTWCSSDTGDTDIAAVVAPHVVVISARVLLGKIALGKVFPDVMALHDESHYSDYSAYTWRNVAAEYEWVRARVAMSATLTPSIKSDNTS
ncbi:hypothetical protein ACFFON_17095, partial [Arthrobacter citreus]